MSVLSHHKLTLQRTTAPTLVWKPEQKKSGNAYFPAQVLTPLEEIGSLVVDDYSVDKRENQSEIVLEHGSGLKLSADSWFT